MATVAMLPNRQVPAPDDLTDEEAAMWADVMKTKPTDWWDAASLPLLSQYCRLQTQCIEVGHLVGIVLKNLRADPTELSRYTTLRKVQSGLTAELNGLARAMRLTQQSRYRPDKAIKPQAVRKPWETEG